MSKKQLLFSRKGRISRRDYWAGYLYSFLFFLLPVLIIFGVFGAATIVTTGAPDENLGFLSFTSYRTCKAIATLIALPLLLCYTYTSFCVVIKRLHDLNYNGWFSLYRVIPTLFITFATTYGVLNLIAFIITIILGSVKGVVEENKYGINPII